MTGSPPSTASSRKSSRSLAESDRTLHMHEIGFGRGAGKRLEEGSALSEEDNDIRRDVCEKQPGSPGLYAQDSGTPNKTVAITLYLVASSALQLLVIAMARRAAFPAAATAIPAEAVIGGIVATIWKRAKKEGGHGFSDLQGRRRSLFALAIAIFLATLASLLQAGIVPPSLVAFTQIFHAPALTLILPLMGLSDFIAGEGVPAMAACAVALFAGMFTSSFGTHPTMASVSLFAIVAEAAKLALLKRFTMQSQHGAKQTLLTLYPILAILSLTVMPLRAASSTFSPMTKSWPVYLAGFVVIGAVDKYATVHATMVVESPVALAQMATLRAAIVFAFSSLAMSNDHTTLITIIAAASLAAVACLAFLAFRSDRSGNLWTDLTETLYHCKVLRFNSKTGCLLAAIAVVPLLVSLSANQLGLPMQTAQNVYTKAETVDIVISTYNEPAENVRSHIDKMKTYWWIRERQPRVILYLKGNISASDPDSYRRQAGADVAIHLENKGREAGTFLAHIVNNYNASIDPMRAGQYRAGLADHTLFMQHHLAWDWIARERLWLFKPNTGYLHFAPYIKLDCGKDMDGNGDFPRIAQVYSMFREELCPPTLQLGAYAAQFVVSKKRILANSYRKYKTLLDIITAEAEHWIHQEGTWWHYHGAPGPENPYFGHAMERSWPIIFGCTDPSIKDTCKDIADENTVDSYSTYYTPSLATPSN